MNTRTSPLDIFSHILTQAVIVQIIVILLVYLSVFLVFLMQDHDGF